MKNSVISILLWFVSGIAAVYAQERSVEGFLKEGDQSVTKIKLFENEQNETVLFMVDSSSNINLDSIIQANNYSAYTINDSIRKLNDTIQQVVILQNGQLQMLDVQLDLKVKKYTESFTLKISSDENPIGMGSLAHARTLEISYKYWCMGTNTYSDTKEQCESTCTEECYKRTF